MKQVNIILRTGDNESFPGVILTCQGISQLVSWGVGGAYPQYEWNEKLKQMDEENFYHYLHDEVT